MSIASEITRLTTAKADLKTAIEGKGVTVPSDATLDDYADYVDDISYGGDLNKKWTTDGIMALTEPSGDIVIDYQLDIMLYAMQYRTGITSIRMTYDAPCDIGNYAFAHCVNLQDAFFKNISGKTLGTYVFAYATELSALTIQNATDSTLGSYLVRNNKCKVIKINGTPASISANAFRNNTTLTDLYVSWAEGDVADAPWSLRSQATIHYETVFDENMDVVSYVNAVNTAPTNSLMMSGINNDDEEEEVTE